LETADAFMAVRWTKSGELWAAVMLTKAVTAPLYAARLQRSGRLAHIHWSDWTRATGAVDLTYEFRAVLGQASV
jgi:hypothetical protein